MWQLRRGQVSSGSATAGSSPYFFSERFEGTGYQNAWAEAGTGTIDEDYTTSPLEGSQSLRIAAVTQNPKITINLPSSQGEIWAFFRLRINVALSASRRLFVFLDNGGLEFNGTALTAGNGLQPICGGSLGTATASNMTTGSDYNVWLHCKTGTGADGLVTVAWSATGTEPTSGSQFSQKTNGTNTTDNFALSVRLTTDSSTNTTGEVVIDQILLSNIATIGNNPA